MAKFCTNCGNELKEGEAKCVSCGNVIGTPTQTQNTTNNQAGMKSKLVAGLLGIFVGSLGIHNFYLGYTGKAVAQLLLTLIGWVLCGIGPVAAGLWGLIEGILILTGSINVDANGNQLGE